MSITINDHNYRNTWGKAPRGGDGVAWAFEFDGIQSSVVFFDGNYSEAKKQAIKHAREMGYEYGQVLS